MSSFYAKHRPIYNHSKLEFSTEINIVAIAIN
jgi:hypothetical protein